MKSNRRGAFSPAIKPRPVCLGSEEASRISTPPGSDPSGLDGKLRVIIVRHGQTPHNREGRFRGLLDVPLDETGQEQARRSAAFLRQVLGVGGSSGGLALHTGPLARTRQTAAPLAADLGITATSLDELNDVDVGLWQGVLIAEVAEREPAAYRLWTEHPAAFRFPGGDSLAGIHERSAKLLACLASGAASGDDRDVVLYTHQVPAKLLVAAALGLGPEAFWRLRVDNAAVSVLERERGRFALTLFNASAHLSML